jgi:uncharacterized protein (TIGR02646 family)
LARYRHGRDVWDDLTPADRVEIRHCLEQLQGRRCAYCEASLDAHGEHIEHFRQRGRFAQGTFDWQNLFLSCARRDSCGKHKDTCQYPPTDLIKPDTEDPERFFLFVANGSIVIRRADLTLTEQRRAESTLRIFNLDAQRGALRKMRQTAISGYLETLKELQELAADCSPQDIQAYLDAEFCYVAQLPFCTAIKHTLTLA